MIKKDWFYASMPMKVYEDKRLTGDELILYSIINGLTHMTGFCFASNGALARMYRKANARTIQRYLHRLEECGHIVISFVDGERRIATTYKDAADEDVISAAEETAYDNFDALQTHDKSVVPPTTNLSYPHDKSVVHNCIDNTNILNTQYINNSDSQNFLDGEASDCTDNAERVHDNACYVTGDTLSHSPKQTDDHHLRSFSDVMGVETSQLHPSVSAAHNAESAIPDTVGCSSGCNTDNNTPSKSGCVEASNTVSAKSKKRKRSTEHKHRYGEYDHVLLTDAEYGKLVKDFGEAFIRDKIRDLDEYLEMHRSKHYDNHNLTIRNWIRRDNKRNGTNNYNSNITQPLGGGVNSDGQLSGFVNGEYYISDRAREMSL